MDPTALFGIMLGGFAIFAIFIFPLALIGWLILRLSSGGRKEQATSEEESRLIQELYNGLGRMERRVESLETLLLERERKEAGHDV